MFELDAARRWTRQSALACGNRAHGPKVTRRQVLTLGALGSGLLLPGPAWAQTSDGIFATPFGAEIRFGGRSWSLRRDALGVANGAAITIATAPEHRITVAGASWPGTGIAFDLSMTFTRSDGAWTMALLSSALGLDCMVGFADFLDGVSGVTTTLDAGVATRTIRRLGWSVSAPNGCTLRLRPDLAWEITGRGLRCSAGSVAAARSLTVSVHRSGHGATVSSFFDTASEWTTETSGSPATASGRPRLKCGTLTNGSYAELVCVSISEAVTVVSGTGKSAIALVGVWRMNFTTRRRSSGGFRSVNGLVLIGKDTGTRHIVASLPIDGSRHSVDLPGGAPSLLGDSDDHRLELVSRDGIVEHCEAKALVAAIALPMKGADVCEFLLDEGERGREEITLTLDDRRIPDSPWTMAFALVGPENWWLPLRYGRLRINRARDLLDVQYSFRGLALARRIGGWRLELDGSGLVPTLVAELPPQHVMERAFFHQDPLAPSKPSASVKPTVQLDKGNPNTADGQPPSDAMIAATLDSDFAGTSNEPLVRVAEARLSGRSRLAFEVPTKKRDVRLGFDLASLTDFASLKLVVAPAAARPMTKPDASGAVRPETDPICILKARGLHAGSSWRARWFALMNSVSEPDRYTTAIELPARLVLSPDQNARFTSRGFATSTFDRSAAPLWTVRLALDDVTEASHAPVGHVRAIYSPDFRHKAFENRGQAPRQGHEVPWTESGPKRKLRLPMSSADRHELVALSSLCGLPTLPRLPTGKAQGKGTNPIPDNIVPPQPWKLREADDEQGIYIPPPMAVRELALTSLGGSLDILARFEPPAAPYAKGQPTPLFDALNIEGWTQRTVLGRDVSVELVYKGFLFPFGIRAALLKRTERYFLAAPGEQDGLTAYLVQHYFIQLPKPEKQYPGLGHPFDARDFPAAKVNFRTRRTPDLLDPFADAPANAFEVSPEGVIRLPARRDGTGLASGLAFWPRTGPKLGNEVQFEYEVVGQPGTMQVPLIFLDNTAAHDPATVEAAISYYQRTVTPDTGLKTVTMRGASRRYAPEREPGSATFETARWVLGVRGRVDRPASPYAIDGAMEGADQPPFYPYMREAHLRLGSVQRFSGRSDDLVVASFDPLYTHAALSRNANPAQSYLAVHGYLPKKRGEWFNGALEPARLDITGVGDRSGGVCQPNQLIIAMSLINGTIGGQAALDRPLLSADAGDPPPSAPPGALVATPPGFDAPAPNTARSGVLSGADFFPSDARLLGLLSLSDLIKTALYATAPRLVETLAVAEDEANAQLAALLTKLRDVIKQVAGGLRDVSAMLEAPGPDGLPSAAQLYPRLAAAVVGIRQALESLRGEIASGGAPVSHLPALAREAGELGHAINGLLAELDRVGHHPMPELLATLLRDLDALASLLRGDNALGALVRDAVRKAIVEPVLAELGREEGRVWLALVLGVGPDIPLHDPGKPAQVLAAIIQTANEAVSYETVGRPILEAIAAVEAFGERADGASGDVRQAALRGFELVGKLIDALDGALQGPLAKSQVESVRLCETVKDALAAVLAEGALVSLGTIDKAIEGLDGPLTRMASIEAEVQDHIAAFDRLGAPPGEDPAYRVLRTRVDSARDMVIRLRTGTAGTLDRLRDARKALEDEARRASSNLRNVCVSDPEKLSFAMGAVAGWMKVRLQFLEDALLLFPRVSEALGSASPAAGPAMASLDELTRVSKAIDTASGSLAAEATALLSRAIDLVIGVTSATRSTQLIVSAVSTLLPYLDPSAQASMQGFLAEATGKAATVSSRLAALQARLNGLDRPSAAVLAKELVGSTELMGAVRTFARDCERRLIGAMLPPVAARATAVHDKLLGLGEAMRGAIVGPLLTIHRDALDAWAPLVDGHPELLDDLELVIRPEAIAPFVSKGPGTLRQALTDQVAELTKAADPSTSLGDALAILRTIASRIALVRREPNTDAYADAPALYCLARELGGMLDTLLHGQLGQIIDLDSLRSRVEGMLFSVTLPDVDVSYAFDTDINDLPPFFAMDRANKKEAGTKDLSLSFKMHASPGDGGTTSMTASGVLQPFDIKIPEIVTLQFQKVTFVSKNGSKPDFDIKLKPDGILLGPAVKFVEKLSDYLGVKGNGFYIDLRSDPAGVEAGFALNLGTVGLGEVSFLNVSLGASVELPFDNRPAIFRFNLAFRESPFLISVAPFGGGGFLSIAFDPKGIVGFEAAFEYGGVIAFGFGPLSGQGMVLTGIYIARSAASTRITGFFIAAGSAHIACFGVGACLYVGVEQQAGGRVQGHAEYTFSFSIGLGDIHFKVPVDRLIPQGFGAGGSSHNSNSAAASSRSLFHASGPSGKQRVLDSGPRGASRVRSVAKAMVEDWDEYLSYFDEDL